jgi:hypothetical protein
MNNIIMMRIGILLFLLISHSATHAATILSQGARNVKNGAAYGGASAVGDGVHDDTQAILDAININRHFTGSGNCDFAAVYIPPGTYMVTKMIVVWDTTFLFGEPSNPATIVLKSGSMTSGSSPFICPLANYNHNAYDTNWDSAGVNGYASSNNTFFLDIRDINFTVQANNPGCFTVMLWRVAQQASFRNSVLTGYGGLQSTLQTGDSGGNAFVNITCNGNATAWTSWPPSSGDGELFLRDCTFNGSVNANVNDLDFVACTFNDPTGSGVTISGGSVFGMYDCVLTPGTSFNPSGETYHLENTNLNGSVVVQQTSSNNGLWYNRVQESSSSSNLNTTGVTKGTPYPNPAYPYPTSACVNVKSFGAKGDGSTDDTNAINAALSASNEVFFPFGNYYVGGATITLPAGKKLFGHGSHCTTIQGSGSPVVNLLGAGSGLSSVIANIVIQRVGGTSGHILDMNCDQSSLIMDSQVDSNSTYVDESVRVQTGGGVIENAWWTGDVCTNGGIIVTSTDPLFFYSIQPEHWKQPCFVFNGAKNVTIINLEMEGSTPFSGPAAMTVTNSSGIFLHGIFIAQGSGDMPIGVLVNNSQLNLWPMMMNNFPGGMVNENGTSYGPANSGDSETTIDGYVDFTASPIQLQSRR